MSESLESETPEEVTLPAESGSGEVPPDFGEVLKQVISAANSDPDASAQDLALRQQLRAVAVKFAGQELTMSPVLVSLVAAVNARCRYLTAGQKSGLNQAVARTLYEDSESRARLEALWHSLVDSAR